MSGKSKFQISRSLDERIKRIINGTNEYDSEFSNVSSAYILGFNYGNVTNCVGLTTNYQLHHAVFPVVGIVFFRFSPTDDDIKTSLRSIQEFSSSPNGLGSFKADKNEHLFLIYNVDKETNEVEKRIFNFTKGTFVRRKRLRLNVLNDPYCPRQVNGGSEDLFNLDDGDSLSSSDDDHIDHLIFFIHGVGGVCDVRFRSCVEVVADFKKMANNLLAQQGSNSSPSSSGESTPSLNKHLAQHLKKGFFRKHSSESTTSHGSDVISDTATKPSPATPKPRRVECLPISWHSLTRRQTGMNDQLNLIALSSVPKLRYFLNKVVMDALLYASGPVYTQTIINNVGNEINRLYTLFMEKHPNFTGSISLAGHSLGSVIVFDLLAHQLASNEFSMPSSSTTATGTTEKVENNNNLDNDNKSGDATGNNNNDVPSNHVGHHVAGRQSGHYLNYKNLEELLIDMNLTRYSNLFHKEHIDLSSLLLLTDSDMKELNLPLGVRRKLGTFINMKKVSQIPVGSKLQHESDNNTHNMEPNMASLNNSEIGGCKSPSMNNNNNNNNNNSKLENNLNDNMNTGQYLVEYPQLKFKPRCFFAFGSPTPMFLNVRGIQNISKEYKLPTCDRMFNIFHPYDPLAYRIEPLIDPRFKNVEPILLAHHRGGKRIHVQLREGFAKVGHDIKHRLLGSLRNTWSSFTRFSATSPEASESRSPSVDSNCELRSRRLTKSASSSVDVEIESFEGAINMMPSHYSSHHHNHQHPHHNQNPNQNQQHERKPLKRQQELVRSQSEIHGANLSSIIDNSMKMDTELDGETGVAAGNHDITSTSAQGHQQQNAKGGTLSDSELFRGLGSANRKGSMGKGSGAAGGKSTKDNGDTVSDETDNGGKQKSSRSSVEFDSTTVGRLNGGRRIDYVLQEKPIELFNEYIFAFTSHANYWQNEDSALIILNEIYQVEGIQLFDHLYD